MSNLIEIYYADDVLIFIEKKQDNIIRINTANSKMIIIGSTGKKQC